MEKIKKFLRLGAVRLSVCGLLIFFSVYFAFPDRGVLTTFAFVVAAGLILPFYYEKPWVLVPIAALSAALLALVFTASLVEGLFYILVLTAFFALAVLSGRLLSRLAGEKDGRKWGYLGIAAALALFFLWAVVFGNPVTLVQTSNRVLDAYGARYPRESFTVDECHFDPLARRYQAAYTVSSGEVFTAAEDEDGYLLLMKNRAAALQKSELLKLLHGKFAEGNYLISVTPGTAPAEEPCPYLLGDTPEEWWAENEITLEFYTSVPVGSPEAKASFASRVRAYVTFLREENFPFASLTFRGGEQGQAAYELVALPDTPVDELVAPRVTELNP